MRLFEHKGGNIFEINKTKNFIQEKDGVVYFDKTQTDTPKSIDLSKYGLPKKLKFLGEGSAKVAYTDGKLVYKMKKSTPETVEEDFDSLKKEVAFIKDTTSKVNAVNGLPIYAFLHYSYYREKKDAGLPTGLPKDEKTYEYVKFRKSFCQKYKFDDLDIKILDNGIIIQKLAPKPLITKSWNFWTTKQRYDVISAVLKEKHNINYIDTRSSGNMIIRDDKNTVYIVEL